VAWITVKESRQHGHHIYSVEAIKLEALERKVEVVSGYTPHASSASTQNIIAKAVLRIKRVFAFLGFSAIMSNTLGQDSEQKGEK